MRSIALGLIVIASILLIEDWITCLVKKNEGNMAVREIITLFLGILVAWFYYLTH